MMREELVDLSMIELIKLNKLIDIELFSRVWWVIPVLAIIGAGWILWRRD
jgi:hypothetical protein